MLVQTVLIKVHMEVSGKKTCYNCNSKRISKSGLQMSV
jgi:hypothetical protein